MDLVELSLVMNVLALFVCHLVVRLLLDHAREKIENLLVHLVWFVAMIFFLVGSHAMKLAMKAPCKKYGNWRRKLLNFKARTSMTRTESVLMAPCSSVPQRTWLL